MRGGCLEEEEGSSWSGIAMLNGASNTSRPRNLYSEFEKEKEFFSVTKLQ